MQRGKNLNSIKPYNGGKLQFVIKYALQLTPSYIVLDRCRRDPTFWQIFSYDN